MDKIIIPLSTVVITLVFKMKILSFLHAVAVFFMVYGLYKFFLTIVNDDLSFSWLIVSGVSLLILFILFIFTYGLLALRATKIKKLWEENYSMLGGNYTLATSYTEVKKLEKLMNIKWTPMLVPTVSIHSISALNPASSKVRFHEMEDLLSHLQNLSAFKSTHAYFIDMRAMGQGSINAYLTNNYSDEYIESQKYMKFAQAVNTELDTIFSNFGKIEISKNKGKMVFTVPYAGTIYEGNQKSFIQILEDQFNTAFELSQNGGIVTVSEISKEEKQEAIDISSFAVRAFVEAANRSKDYIAEPTAIFVKNDNEFGVDLVFSSFNVSDEKYKNLVSKFIGYMEKKYPLPGKRWAIKNAILSEGILKVRRK